MSVKIGIIDEMRRRGVVRVAAVYIIAAWLIIQVADVFFPAWDIPQAALRYMLGAAVLGFPIALIFGWMYDITPEGIRRTAPAGADAEQSVAALRRSDHVTLTTLVVAAGLILYSVTGAILETTTTGPIGLATVDKPPNSVAVLPFVNISDDPANEYFCDGISEEILHRLADYRDMHVLGRNSSFAFKDSEIDTIRLADILGVRYLLQGSVRKVGDELRISASLVDDNNRQLWNETYDRRLEGVFAIQTEIAAAVADSLATTMAASLVQTDAYTPDIDAYQQFLLGREYLRARTPGYQANAIEHFDIAMSLDERYAAPHAGRAIALLLTTRDSAHYADRIEEAERSIDAALALDPELPIGHAARGLLLSFLDNPAGSEESLRKALALDPNLPGAPTWLGNALANQERYEEALAVWENAVRRNPLDPQLATNLASRYSRRGDFHRAEQQYRRLLDLPKPPERAYSGLFHLYDSYGRYVDMIAAGKQWILAHVVPESEPHYYYAFLAYGYARLGMYKVAEQWQDRAEAVDPVDPGTRMRRAYINRIMGRYEEMEAPILAVLNDQGLDLDRMPPFIARVVGAVRILTGHPEEGIELIAPTFDLSQPQPWGALNADFIQAVAYAHKKLGNTERATEILELVAEGIRIRQRLGDGRDPNSLIIMAQNHIIGDDIDAAIAALEVAMASGYRHYSFVLYDERWNPARGDPRFEELIAQMKADVDAQRARVERIEAEDDFEAALQLALRRSRSD